MEMGFPEDVVDVQGQQIQLFPGRTALKRDKLSVPMRALLNVGLVSPERSLFDYGCGYGDDLRFLAQRSIKVLGWDPYHRPKTPKRRADIVTCLYVLDSIADPEARASALKEAWRLSRHYLVVAGRSDKFIGETWPYADGWISQRSKVFLTYYSMRSMQEYVEAILGGKTHKILNMPWTLVLPRSETKLLQDLVEHRRRLLQQDDVHEAEAA